MKRIANISLATVLGFALFQPDIALAKGQQGNGQGKGGGNGAARGAVAAQPQIAAPAGNTMRGASHRGSVAVTPSGGSGVRFRGSQSVRNQTATAPVTGFAPSSTRVPGSSRLSNRIAADPSFASGSFSRSNNYGGLWVDAARFPSWDRNRVYFWNNHPYCWYDGGWLMIDAFWPSTYPYYPAYADSYRGYDYPASATVTAVQEKLAAMGYYDGYPDGIIGPMTRGAIANYQRDYGLPVTGRIDHSLLVSLGLA